MNNLDGDPTCFLDEEIDQDGENRKKYKKSLKEREQFYAESVVSLNEQRAKRDFFYATFFNYDQCNMDESLQEMIKMVEKVYLGDDDDSKFIKKNFNLILKGSAENSHYKTLKIFLMCVMIGREKSIRQALQLLCHSDAEHYGAPRHELTAATSLFNYLPNRVDMLTKSPWNLTNIDVLVKQFASDCVYIHNGMI